MTKLLAVESEIVGRGTGETEANSKLSIDWLLFVRQLKGRRGQGARNRSREMGRKHA